MLSMTIPRGKGWPLQLNSLACYARSRKYALCDGFGYNANTLSSGSHNQTSIPMARKESAALRDDLGAVHAWLYRSPVCLLRRGVGILLGRGLIGQ